MENSEKTMATIIPFLDKIKDVRVDRHKKYPLNEIVFLVLVSVMCGNKSWDEFAEFGKAKINWFKKYMPYKNEIPSSDTLRRVFSLIDYKEFELYFTEWAKNGIKLSNDKIISIDGKVLRKSSTKMEHQTKLDEGGKRPIYLLHAWCSDLKYCLGQLSMASKANEISTIPKLLSILDIKNSIITIDAAGCQTAIAEQIIKADANYIFSLKDDKKALLEAVKTGFSDEKNQDKITIYNQDEKRKGHNEKRIYHAMPIEFLENHENIQKEWAGLKTIVKVNYTRHENFKKHESIDFFFITSLSIKVENLAKLIRSHWSIENNLHWTLDVIFKEDDSKNRNKNTATNLSTIRKCAINLLKGMATDKLVSIKKMQYKLLLWDDLRSAIFD